MATIRDVAKRAGVSAATVSHVINDSRYVKNETKQRVVSAIAELNYRRDGIARSLRRSETGTIGIILSDISNPFFSDLFKGIERVIYDLDNNLNLILSNTEEDIKKELLYIEVLMEKRIDGLILAPAGGNETYLSALVERGFPLVFVDRSLVGVSADCVMSENQKPSRDMVEDLLRRGHRRIAVLKADLHANSIEERQMGYSQAIENKGLNVDPELVFVSASNVESACEAGLKMLELQPRPDAVFCTNNFMTLGMMKALRQRELRCPEDIAIAGYDDLPGVESFRPGMSAIAQPSFDIGQEAARLLYDRMKKRRTGSAVKLTLETTMHIRESSG